MPVLLMGGEFYRVNQIDKALAVAKEKRLPLAVLWTSVKYDESSDIDGEISSSDNALFKSGVDSNDCVLVVAYKDGSGVDLSLLPEAVQKTLQSSRYKGSFPIMILFGLDGKEVIGSLTNPADARVQVEHIVNRYQSKHDQDDLSGPDDSGESGQFTCTRKIDAFSPENPQKRIGTFKPGTKLSIESAENFPGYRRVTFQPKKGNPIHALCRATDVEP